MNDTKFPEPIEATPEQAAEIAAQWLEKAAKSLREGDRELDSAMVWAGLR